MAKNISGRVVFEKCPVCRRSAMKIVYVKELFGILGAVKNLNK